MQTFEITCLSIANYCKVINVQKWSGFCTLYIMYCIFLWLIKIVVVDQGADQKTCPPVVMPMCLGHCQFTHQKDAAGCDVYDCVCSTSSPPAVCPPICEMYCQYGFETDANGCEICKCKKDAPAMGISTPRWCPRTCDLYCVRGLRPLPTRCRACKCKNPRRLCGEICAKGCGGFDPNLKCRICKCKKAVWDMWVQQKSGVLTENAEPVADAVARFPQIMTYLSYLSWVFIVS